MRRPLIQLVLASGFLAVALAAGVTVASAATCSASPATVEVDETVTLDASGSDATCGEFDAREGGPGIPVTHADTGDSDSASYGTVTVQQANQRPTADLAVSPRPATAGEEVTLDASGSTDEDGSIVEYRWDFDGDESIDATTDTATTTHVYDTSGSYSPGVTVVDDDGDTDTRYVDLTVQEPPAAELSIDPSPSTTGESVSFDAGGSFDSDGRIVEYRWDYDGDGTTDLRTETATTTHTYDAAGSYTPSVTVVDDDGGTDTAQRDHTVEGPNESPVAELVLDPQPSTVGQSVSFDASGSADPDGRIVEYRWDYDGDGTTDLRTETATTTHTYDTAGSYTPSVTVVDNEGATGTAQVDHTVEGENAAPTANLAVSPRPATVGEETTFDASESSDSDGSIVEYRWDFDGDESIDATTETATTTHVYDSSGSYVPSVTVVDDDGARATDFVDLTVQEANEPPAAELGIDPSPSAVGESVSFDAGGSFDSDGSIVEYRWDFDGDGTTDTTTETATTANTYDAAGTYTPSVTVVDDDGATDTAEREHTVEGDNEPPAAELSIDPSPSTAGESVSFDAGGSFDSDGSIVEYRWDFDGDGATDETTETATTTRVYGSGGTYTARVTVVDDDGATDTAERELAVEGGNERPTAELDISPQSATVGETITFDASGSSDPDGTIVEYRWDFDGDGATDETTETATTTHVYDSADTYQPRVTVVDDGGATAVAGADLSADGTGQETELTARCTVSPRAVGTGEEVTVDASESTGGSTYSYDLNGNGEYDRVTDRGVSVSVSYSEAGTYTPRVRVESGERSDTADCPTITVEGDNRPPDVRFRTNRTNPTADAPVEYNATGSSDPDGTIVEYRWDFDGDGTVDRTTTQPRVVYNYSAGTFTPTLTVVDDDGASNSATGEFVVREPQAATATPTDSPTPTDTIPSVPVVPIAAGGGLLGLGGLSYYLLSGGGGGGAAGGGGGAGGGGDGKPTPKPKPGLSGSSGGQYETGAFELPTESGTVSVPVGFEPDLIVLTAANAARTDATVDRTAGWSQGMASRTDDGMTNQCLAVADDAHSMDQATCAVADDLALQVIRHQATGPLGRVTARVTDTTADSFEVDVSVPGDDPFAGGIRVLYRALSTDEGTSVETGHFSTATEPGTQTVDLGVEAEYLGLSGSTAVSATDRLWTTDRATGLSVGHVTADTEASVAVSTWPGGGHGNAGSGANAAIDLLYQDAEKVAGRTRATALELGSELRLQYDRTYSGPHKLGSTASHPVSYLAVAGSSMAPAVGTVALPAPGETVSVDCGFEPALLEVSIAPAPAGETVVDATASPFGWSEGTAITTGDRIRQYLVHHAVTPERPAVRTPTEPGGPTDDGSVDGAAVDAAGTDGAPPASTDGGEAASAAPAGADISPVDLPPADPPEPEESPDDGTAPPAREYGHDGRVGLWLARDEDGVVVGRDELTLAGTGDDGFDLLVEAVSTDRRAGGERRPAVVYRAWPRPGEAGEQ